MRKLFGIVALAILVIASGCAKVEVVDTPDKLISFTVGTYASQTRADGDPVALTVEGISSFQSKAYLHGAGIDGFQNYFGSSANSYVETISLKSGDSPQWLPSHDYYWPKSSESYINFISWYGGEPSVSYSKTDDVWGATFSWENVTVAADDNLMWADAAWRYNANVNPATYQDYNNVAEGIPTLFHHALAQVCFLAKIGKSTEGTGNSKVDWTVSVYGLSVGEINNEGTFYMAADDPGAKGTGEWTVTGWSSLSGSSGIVSEFSEGKALTATADTLLGWSGVIPQTLTDVELNIDYTVTTTYANGTSVTEPVSATVDLVDFDGGITAWERGKRITYTIIINPDTQVIKLIPVEKDWKVESVYNLTVE